MVAALTLCPPCLATLLAIQDVETRNLVPSFQRNRPILWRRIRSLGRHLPIKEVFD
jgi:hypothetical protein